MSSLKQSGSTNKSESDKRYAMVDEKKRKRMISNRESARRSRMKKQKLMQDLTDELGTLQVSNNSIVGKIDDISEKYMIYAAENNVLRAQTMELTDRLKSLNDLIKNCELAAVAKTQVPDSLLEPWQLPCSMQPIPAFSGLFQI